jgi:transcriptional antiterminator NusG
VIDETNKSNAVASEAAKDVAAADPAQQVADEGVGDSQEAASDRLEPATETNQPSEVSADALATNTVEEMVADAGGAASEEQGSGEDESDSTEAIAVDEVEDEDAGDGDVAPIESIEEEPEVGPGEKNWYILKVQVNRESSICDALRRRVKVEGLEDYFGEILVPTEDVREFTKTGKQRVVKRKLYPGYIVVNMAINDDTWFVVRETPGIGDFTGSAGKPTPMLPHEIERILKAAKPDEHEEKEIKTTIKFKQGDRVRVKEGHFENFEGEIDTVDETHGRVTVMINIFGRPTPVELEHWQVEDV